MEYGNGFKRLWEYITSGFKYDDIDYNETREKLNKINEERKLSGGVIIGGNGEGGNKSELTNIIGGGLVVLLLIMVIFDR